MVLTRLAAAPGLFSHKLALQNAPIETVTRKTNREGHQGTGLVVPVLLREVFPEGALWIPGFEGPAAQCCEPSPS